ncbi:8336_t:CDS:2, partial [Cetraspora pellucida]
MKAVRFNQKGAIKKLFKDIAKSNIHEQGELLIKVHAMPLIFNFSTVLGRFPFTSLPRNSERDFAGIAPPELLNKEVFRS